MSALDKLKKNTTIKESEVLTHSKFFNQKEFVQTTVPALNVALSGQLDGGLSSGLTVFAGPSKHFKTAFAMLLAKAYLDKYDDAVILFYDSEFGAPQGYFDSFGIDTDRVVHSPITDIEQLKHDVMSQLNDLERTDQVMIIVDSVGNLASKKEVDDALDGKSVADMTRAKQMKSLFRMITPHLTLKDIPAVVVNHTYKEIGLFPKDIVSGGMAFTILPIISSSLVDNKRKKELMLSDTILSSMWKSQDTSVKSQRYQLRSRGKD